jgi:predicted metal-binding membrane protein
MRIRVPLLAVSAAAWLLLIVQPHEAAVCMMPSMRWTPASLFAASALMFAAMMVPLIGPPVLHVRDSSLARRRPRAIALFVASYGLPWIVAGGAMLFAGSWIVAADSPLVLPAAVVALAAWQCSPIKQRCLNRCHAHTALSAFGAKADFDVLRFGFVHAWWCVGSCVALMVLPMLFVRGHLVMMAIATLWLAAERVDRPAVPRWSWRGPQHAVRIAVGQTRTWLRRRGRKPVAQYGAITSRFAGS